MKLYLMRHAKPDGTSGDDPLGLDGSKQAQKLASMYLRLGVQPTNVRLLASELKRARQTATIIYKKLNALPTVLTTFPTAADQAPGVDLIARMMTRLRAVAAQDSPAHIIVVGHYPYIGEALNFLVGNNLMEWPPLNYGATAHVECPQSFAQGTGKLRWFILPELL
jgi:phosphohistidine phosphatase SixA